MVNQIKKRPANRPKSGKKGHTTTTTWKKGMPSPNPNGRPKEGQSWAAIFKHYAEYTPEQLSFEVGGEATQLGKRFLGLPPGVPIKHLVVMNLLIALMKPDPSPGLIQEFLDRSDGRVTQSVNVDSPLSVQGLEEVLDKVYGKDTKS